MLYFLFSCSWIGLAAGGDAGGSGKLASSVVDLTLVDPQGQSISFTGQIELCFDASTDISDQVRGPPIPQKHRNGSSQKHRTNVWAIWRSPVGSGSAKIKILERRVGNGVGVRSTLLRLPF